MITLDSPDDLPEEGRSRRIDPDMIRFLLYCLGVTRRDMLEYIVEKRRQEGKVGPDESTLYRALCRGKVTPEMNYEIRDFFRSHLKRRM